MEPRRRKLIDQLGKRIPEPGAHMSHAIVGLVLKKRRRKQDLKIQEMKKGATDKPMKTDDPFPYEFHGENM